MNEVDIYYPNEEPEKPKESVVDSMNNLLAENTKDGERFWSVQKIAETLGVDEDTYNEWINDEDFIDGLKGYLNLQETGVPEAFDNRLDAGAIAVHIMETKHRHSKDENDK